MDKKAVADFLKVTVRRVEVLDKQNAFGEKKDYIYTKHGKTRDFNEDAVKQWKHRRDNPEAVETPTLPKTQETAMMFGAIVEAIKLLSYQVEQTRQLSAGETEKHSEQTQRESVRIAEKLMLSVAECRILSGLPESFIRQAIAQKELKAQKIGRGLKINRKILDAWIDSL